MTEALAAWLREQIADDERVALAAVGHLFSVNYSRSDAPVVEHIERWSSSRVIAECIAKRRIIDEIGMTEDLLRLLARPYAERPGFRVEWLPGR